MVQFGQNFLKSLLLGHFANAWSLLEHRLIAKLRFISVSDSASVDERRNIFGKVFFVVNFPIKWLFLYVFGKILHWIQRTLLITILNLASHATRSKNWRFFTCKKKIFKSFIGCERILFSNFCKFCHVIKIKTHRLCLLLTVNLL